MQHLLKCHPIVPVNFTRGENCHVFDEQGRRFVDLESGSWAAVLGHSHPRVNAVLKDQVDRIMHLSVRFPNHLAEEAATDLLGLLGWSDGRCTFLSSGSEAVEFGVQVARRISGRPLLLTLSNAYLAAFGSAGAKSPDEWHLVDPQAATIDDIERVLASIPFDKIGGFVFEPGGGGPGFVRFPPAPLVEAIARRVQAEGQLVIVNEITTGMGRTGTWFGFQHYDVQPDIVAIGKGLGNGYPISATVMRGPAAAAIESRTFHHAQSHQNNPLGCAVAREVIAILRNERWIERGKDLGASFLEDVRRIQEHTPAIKEVRGRGMLWALELHEGGRHTGTSLQAALWERGFIVAGYPSGHPAGTGLRFDPSLTVEQADLTRLLKLIDELLSRDRS